MDFIAYKRETGEITRFYRVAGGAELLPELPPGEHYAEGEGDASIHWAEEWDVPGMGVFAHILEREPLSYQISSHNVLTDETVIISNLPSSARIIIDGGGEGYLLDEGETAIGLSFDTPKIYEIWVVDVFPYLPAIFEVTVNESN